MSKKISEATPKSRGENIARKFRKTHKHKHRDNPSYKPTMDPAGKVTPKKTGNNDPTKRTFACDLDKSLRFIAANLKHRGKKLEEAVAAFPHRERLHDLVSHMVAVSLGGWRQEAGRFINEWGNEASPSAWYLNEEGHLIPLTRDRPVKYNVDWLLEVRRYCEQTATR